MISTKNIIIGLAVLALILMAAAKAVQKNDRTDSASEGLPVADISSLG